MPRRRLATAVFAFFSVTEPDFAAGARTNRPVAALRPSTVAPCLEDFVVADSVRVVMFLMCVRPRCVASRILHAAAADHALRYRPKPLARKGADGLLLLAKVVEEELVASDVADVPELLRMRGSDLQILEYFAIKKGNFAPLTNWLVRRLNATDADIKASRLHKALADLEQCGVYYTTNYDDFLERSIELRVVTRRQ